MVKGYRSRPANLREQKTTLVIVCEGGKTERIYFEKYRERNSGLIIFIQHIFLSFQIVNSHLFFDTLKIKVWKMRD